MRTPAVFHTLGDRLGSVTASAPVVRVRARAGEIGGRVATTCGPPVRRVLAAATPLGRTVVVGGLVAVILGARLGWYELRVLGWVALAVAVLSGVFLLGRIKVAVAVVVEPQRVQAGQPVTGQVDVTSTASAPMLPLTLSLAIGGDVARFDLPALRPRAISSELFVVPTDRRAVIPVGPTRTGRGDPLGLFRREVEWPDVVEVFVRPELVPLDSIGAGFLRDLEGTTSADLSASDLAFHALREYVPGDDLRHVHWKSSAKAQTMLVRQYLDTRRSHLMLVVDASRSSYADPEEDFETAVSVAASVAVRAMTDEFAVSFVCGDQATTGVIGAPVLDSFCRADLRGVDALGLQAQKAFLMAPDTSLAIFVTGSFASMTDLRRAAAVFPVEVRALAVVVDPASHPSVRDVDGLTVLRLPALRDLPAALAWTLR